jgi:GxxExxY protein
MTTANHLLESDLTRSIIATFYTVYNYFGYGLAEAVYAGAVEFELRRRGHRVDREVSIAVRYEGRVVAWQRLDMVVDGQVIVELKATEKMPPYAERQLFNYLRATPYRIGLLLRFGPRPRVHRFVDLPKRDLADTGNTLEELNQDESG